MIKKLFKSIFFFNALSLIGVLVGLWVIMYFPDTQEIFYFMADIKLYLVLFLVLFLFYSWEWLLIYHGRAKELGKIIGLFLRRYVHLCLVILFTVGCYLMLASFS